MIASMPPIYAITNFTLVTVPTPTASRFPSILQS